MKKRTTRWQAAGRLIPLLLLALSFQAQAQTLQPNYGAPPTPVQVANGAAIFKIRINGNTTTCAGPSSLNITLPTGYVYVSGSAFIAAGGGSLSQTSASNNTAVLSVSNIPATPDSTIISYQAYAGCGTIGGSNTAITYSLSTCAGTSVANATVNAQNAQLNITGITNNAFVATNLGQTYTRTITINNDGYGSIDTFYLDSKNSLGLTITGTTSSTGILSVTKTWTASDTTYRYRIIAPTTNGHFENNESLVLTETVKISNCSGATTDFKTWYGANGIECTAVSNTAVAGATVNTSALATLVTSIVTQPDLRCLPVSDWVVYQVKNISSVPGTILASQDGQENIYSASYTGAVEPHGINNCGTRTMYTDTTAGVQISYNGGVTWSALAYNVRQWYGTGGGGYNAGKPVALNFTGLFGTTLAAGDSIRVRYKIHDESPPCCTGDWRFAHHSFVINYQSGCNTTNSHYTGYPSLGWQSYAAWNNSSPDVVAGQPYTLSYGLTIYNPNISTRYANDGYVRYELTIPANLEPTALIADISLTGGSSPVAPNEVLWNAATRKLSIKFLRSSIVNSTTPAVYNLSIKTNPVCIPGNIDGTVILDAYVKAAACAATEWHSVCGVPLSYVLHGCNGACPGGGIYNFSAVMKRTNYGLYAAVNNGIPSGTFNADSMNLNLTLKNDTIAFRVTGKLLGTNNFSNGFLKIATDTATVNACNFLDATAYIYTTAGTLKATISNIPAGTVTDGVRTLGLNQGTASPATYNYAAGDSVISVIRFRIATNQVIKMSFKGELSVANTATPSPTEFMVCENGWTSVINNLQARVSDVTGGYAWFPNCGTLTSFHSIKMNIGGSGGEFNQRHAWFPHEIREVFRYDTVRVRLTNGPVQLERLDLLVVGQGANYTITGLPMSDSGTYSGQRAYYYNISNLSDLVVAAGVPFTEGMQFQFKPVIKQLCRATGIIDAYYSYVDTKVHNLATDSSVWYSSEYALNFDGNNVIAPAISSPSSSQIVSGNTVSWEVQVINSGAIKYNTWLAEASGINGITISSIQELTGAGGTVVSTLPVVNGIYQLGNMASSTSKYYKINAAFSSCIQDSIRLMVDYNCDAYPTSAAIGESGCRIKYLPLSVMVQTPTLQLAKITEPTGTVNLCDNLNYELEVTNSGLGNATNLSVRVQLPFTGGIQYIPGTFGFKYPASASSYTPLADANVNTASGTMVLTIPATALASLPGTENLRIQFQMKTMPCEFTSGEKLTFRPAGKNSCDANIFGTSVAGNRINIVGVPPNLPQFSITSKADSVTACGSGAVNTTYTFKMINTGSIATTIADGFRITLPAPWAMNTAVTFSHNPSVAMYAASPAANVYDFKTGSGLVVGDSIVFTTTLNVASAAALACGSSAPIVESGFVEFATSCANPSTTCNTKQLLEPENATTSIFVKRPAYSISAFSGAASGTPPNHVTGSVTVTNANSIYTPQNGTLKVYQDVNSNGVQDAGDLLIGSQVYAIANQASQTFSYDIAATGNMGNVCPMVAVLELACNCDTPSYSYSCTSVVLPVKFSKEAISADGCAVQLSWKYEASNTIVTGFAIERSNALRNKWELLATLPERAQTYTDMTPGAGQWLYRIKAVNTENEAAYSRTLTVHTDCKGSAVQIFPNPAREQVYITLQGYNEDAAPYSVTDKLGRTVQQGSLKGNSSNTVILNNLASGMYHLHIVYGGRTFVEKVNVLK